MKEFIKSVNWKMFYKIMGVTSFLLIFSKLSPAKDAPPISWLFIFLLLLFIGLVLLAKVYTEMVMSRTPKPLTIRDIRKKKLKKINRRW